jgi:membrane protease YdiL (CAAX protease family)
VSFREFRGYKKGITMENKLVRKDYILILICIAIAIASTFIISKNFTKAFPEASIEFNVTKGQSKEIAADFLNKIGFDQTGYRHSAIFSYHNQAKVFLEKELGAEEANEIMGSKIRLWRWSNRWYKPLEKEEISVRISPKGEFIGFTHLIPEEQKGAFLSADSARLIAAYYLLEEMQLDTSRFEFVQESAKERPNRLDHTFIWKEKEFKIKEADYRYSVTILGDQVGAYTEYLHVPDKWARSYQKLRAKNNTTGMVAGFFLILTAVAMLVVLIRKTRQLDIKWKTSIVFGSIAAVLAFLSYINDLPISLYHYPTADPFNSYILRSIALDFVYALLTGFGIFFVTAAAEPVYRERYKDRISLTNLFTWKGLRTKKFFIAVIVGLTLTFFFAAYQVIFYLLTKKFGGWAPQDIPYDNLLNTAFPWISVLLIGFLPAVSEEFISRMFSIPFFEKFIKYRWLAVIIPAFIWGFGHASYPQQPFYIRGLEVGIAGVIIGFVMLRFGILATLVWHYTVDALYTAFILLRSDNIYFISTAAIGCGIMLLPLVIALIAYIKNKSFYSDNELLNETEGTSEIELDEKEPELHAMPDYSPLTKRRIVIGLVVAAVIGSAAFLKTDKIGDFVKFPSSKEKARNSAVEFLQSLDYDVADYESIAFSSERFSSLTSKYVLENADIERLNKLYSEESKGSRWGVRFYKPLQKEEFSVFVNPRDLSIVSFARTLEEDAEGANIHQDSALVIASDFAAKQNIDIQNMVLKDASSNKRDNRTDHTFVWEAGENDERNINELKYRLSVSILGDHISTFTVNPKLPEAWQREKSKQTMAKTALLILRILIIGAFFVFAIIRFVKEAKLGHIFWKKPMLWAGGVSLLNLAVNLINLSLTKRYYMTSIEPGLFTISTLISVVLSSLLVFGFVYLSLCFLTALYPNVLNTFSKGFRRSFARDAILIVLFNIAAMAGINQLLALLQSKFSKHLLVGSLSLPENINAKLPFLSVVDSSIVATFLIFAISGIVIFIFKDLIKKPAFIILAGVVALVAFLPLNVSTFGEAFISASQLLIPALWFMALVLFFMRNNYLAYFLLPLASVLSYNVVSLLKQQNSFFTLNGIILIAILALLTLWLLLPVMKKKHSN